MKKEKIFYLSLIILFSFAFITILFSTSSEAVGVRPLVIDLDMSPGETKDFELILTPSQSQETVQLSLYHPTQQLTGGLSYQEADPQQHPAANWINLESDRVIVPPGEETRVSGQVNVSYDARGTHTVVIMVEPVVEEAETGITFRVRYAVRININVDRPGLRESIELKDFRLEADDEGRPVLTTHLKNDSPLLYNAAAEVTVRDENRQLLERVRLRSQAAQQAGRDETRIYPGSEVLFSGAITEPLFAGSYDIQLFLYYADGRQLIRRQTVEIGDEFVDLERLEYIEVEPERIEETLRRGGSLTEAINIRNRTGDPLEIKLGAAEIEPEYSRNIFEDFEIQLRGDQEFTLEGRRSGRSVLVVRTPRDIAEGGYYGRVQVGAFNQDGEQLDLREIDLDILVGDDWDYEAETLDLTYFQDEDEILFSVTVINKSNVHISPQARIYLRDETGEILYTLRLNLPEGVERILPEMTAHLTTYATGIEPGDYTADITLQYAGEDIGQKEIPLTIGEEVEEVLEDEEESVEEQDEEIIIEEENHVEEE